MSAVSVPTIAAIEKSAGRCHLAGLERLAVALGAGLTLLPAGSTLGYWRSSGVSSTYHGWTTPPEVLEALDQVVGGKFDLDPATELGLKDRACQG